MSKNMVEKNSIVINHSIIREILKKKLLVLKNKMKLVKITSAQFILIINSKFILILLITNINIKMITNICKVKVIIKLEIFQYI